MDRVTRIRDLEIETSPHFPRGPKLQYPAYAGPFEMPPRNYAQWPSLPQRISCPSPAVWRPAETSANGWARSEEHTSELQSRLHLVCRLLLEKKKKQKTHIISVMRTKMKMTV